MIVGLTLVNAPPSADAGGPYTVAEAGSVELNATGVDPEGTPVTFDWDLDGNGTFETPGQNVTFTPVAPAPATLPVTVRVTDAAGTFATDQATVSVTYRFAGFSQPVDNPPALNTVKAGQAIPVKFSLTGDHGLDIFVPGHPKIELITCPSGQPDLIETTVTAGKSTLTYSTTADQYTYVWKTEKAWAGKCGTLQVMLNDGTTPYTANFKFTK